MTEDAPRVVLKVNRYMLTRWEGDPPYPEGAQPLLVEIWEDDKRVKVWRRGDPLPWPTEV